MNEWKKGLKREHHGKVFVPSNAAALGFILYIRDNLHDRPAILLFWNGLYHEHGEGSRSFCLIGTWPVDKLQIPVHQGGGVGPVYR
jgi:hypothetical protein